MDLKLIPYGCVATGDEGGFIEIVLGSDACAGIDATKNGVLKKEIMEKWLRCVVGRGHVSLLANSDTWHSKPFRDIDLWHPLIYSQHSVRDFYKHS